MKAILYIISLFLIIGGFILLTGSTDLPKKFFDASLRMALTGVVMMVLGAGVFYIVTILQEKENNNSNN